MDKAGKILVFAGLAGLAYLAYKKFGAVLNYSVSFKNVRFGFDGFNPVVYLDAVWQNNSNQNLDISNLYGDVLVNGVYIAQLQSKDSLILNPKQTGTLTLQIGLSPLGVGQSASDLVNKIRQGVNVLFDGYVTINGVTVPVKKSILTVQNG